MKTLIITGALQGNSQDHLHRAAMQVPAPSSGILLSLGATLFAGGVVVRSFGRRKSRSAEMQPSDQT